VTPDEGVALSQQLKCPFYETSAITRQYVDDIFLSLIREIRTLLTFVVRVMVLNATFNIISVTLYILAVSFIGGGNQSTQR
jgi:hypothetical protein